MLRKDIQIPISQAYLSTDEAGTTYKADIADEADMTDEQVDNSRVLRSKNQREE